jgi:hypothetical protein
LQKDDDGQFISIAEATSADAGPELLGAPQIMHCLHVPMYCCKFFLTGLETVWQKDEYSSVGS